MHKRLLLAISVLLAAAAAGAPAIAAPFKTFVSKSQKIGKGSAVIYAAIDEKGAPVALGFSFSKGALDGLPTELNPKSICFDKNGDGRVDVNLECLGDYTLIFELPDAEANKAIAPFKWAMINWNPHGHASPAPPPWAKPHFDFHFYTADRASVEALRPGKCSELLDCADFEKAQKPVPSQYIHPDHIDVGAAVPAMGNHLIDVKSPELAPGGPAFSRTFVIGSNDAHVIFYEPMISIDYLASNPNRCSPIKQPKSWEVAGYYPTQYCVRISEGTGPRTVSLEGFVKRTAN